MPVVQPPTVDSYDRIRGDIPPPPEWTVTANFDCQITTSDPGDPPGYAFTYNWSTPVFDLRPDLSSRIGTTKQGFPIWRRYARLRVQLAGSLGAFVDFMDFTATSTEFIQIFDANVQGQIGGGGSSPRPNLFQVGSADVTSAFFPARAIPGLSQAALGEFSFKGNQLGGGEGYPIRYYRVGFTFRKVVETGLPVPLVPVFPDDLALSAAVY